MNSIYKSIWLGLMMVQVVLSQHQEGTTTNSDQVDEEVGGWKNIAMGFGLVVFGASLSTLGAMMLYLDGLIIRFCQVRSDFSLATCKPFLASSLSFSGGVLAVTIFINLIPEGIEAFNKSNLFGQYSSLAAASYFSICMMLVLLIKFLSNRNSSSKSNSSSKLESETSTAINVEMGNQTKPMDPTELEDPHMKKLGYQIALAIALHNFPEGVVTFVASYQSLKGGLLFGIALALHKFPEGIMIGVPILAGTGSKWKAVLITAGASYITQLLGALFAFLLFKVYWNDIIAGLLFLLASAILTTTLFGGILPLAHSYDHHDKYCTLWLVIGITLFIFMTSVIQ